MSVAAFNRRRHRGFLAIELLTAMAVVGLIGLGVVGLLFMLTAATDEGQQRLSEMVDAQIARARVSESIRHADRCLGAEAETVVLWKGDIYRSGTIERSELIGLVWSSADDSLRLIEPDPLESTPEVTYVGDEDFVAVLQSLVSGGQMTSTPVVDDLTTCAFELIAAEDEGRPLIRVTVEPADDPASRIRWTTATRGPGV